MRFTTLAFLALGPVLAGCSSQSPLGYDYFTKDDSSDFFQFEYPINKVAIVGAGVGGLIAHRELKDAGFDVHSYERDEVPGGNWHYSDEAPARAPIPNADASIGDYEPSLPPKGVKLPYSEIYHDAKQNNFRQRDHRAPKPIWKTLTSNAAAPIQQIRELPWPAGTPWALPNQKLQRYLRAFASFHGLNSNDGNPNISYNTRVELVEKRVNETGDRVGWTLTLKKLERLPHGTVKVTWSKEDYDAVIVATGRYNAPNIPNIDGLPAWAARFPEHISHSRQYRVPEPFANQTILIVGAGTSGGEISREVIQHANKIYQSIRPDNSPIPTFPKEIFLRRIPHNVTIIPEILRFLPVGSKFSDGKIELSNGTVITGVDRIIFATGFRYTFPFLPQFHNSSLGPKDHAPVDAVQPIVTDGTHLRSLYLDAFYIPDPTLVFVNENFGMQSFTYSEFLSLAIAKVWSGKADFPSTKALWTWYRNIYKIRKGYGRHFQFLGAEKTNEGHRFFQGWLNSAAVKYGGKQIDGLSKDTAEISALWIKARFLSSDFGLNNVSNDSITALGLDHDFSSDGKFAAPVDGTESWAQDFVYNDYW